MYKYRTYTHTTADYGQKVIIDFLENNSHSIEDVIPGSFFIYGGEYYIASDLHTKYDQDGVDLIGRRVVRVGDGAIMELPIDTKVSVLETVELKLA